MRQTVAATVLLAFCGKAALAGAIDTSAGPARIDPVVTGLDEPWAIDFLPDGTPVVTERDGRLLLVQDGKLRPVAGGPAVWAEGQGGLLDVMIPRDFAQSRRIWLTFAIPLDGGGATAAGSGLLSADNTRIEGFTIHWQGQADGGGRHFGSRLVEGTDGSVYFTTGDRGTGPDGHEAQDAARAEGKVIRLSADGKADAASGGAVAGLHSLGHRNPQGAAMDGQGRLWLVEHGAQGGDELNLIRQGRNYGWPVISYGENYGGGQIGEGTQRKGMEQPVHYWVPSIAPSGLMIYDGTMFPEWRGDFFTGSLNSDFISRLDPDSGFAEERIAAPQTGRVRDVVQAPDSSIWFLSVHDGAIYRLSREE